MHSKTTKLLGDLVKKEIQSLLMQHMSPDAAAETFNDALAYLERCVSEIRRQRKVGQEEEAVVRLDTLIIMLDSLIQETFAES